MELRLTTHSPLNTVLTDTSGRSLYRISSPYACHNRITTVSKISDVTEYISKDKEGDGDKDKDLDGQTIVAGRSTDEEHDIARLRWKLLSSSVLEFGGFERETSDFIPGKGFCWRYRVFTASDGRSYKWSIGFTEPKLVLNDDNNTPIATFHPRLWHTCRSKPTTKSYSYLEIFPEGRGIIDEIIVTWSFIEKLKAQRHALERGMAGGVIAWGG